MCTLSFVPTAQGYLVAMNRDELLTRAPALRPRIVQLDRGEAIYPREISGGTWIACNSDGNLLALLNWNGRETTTPAVKMQTRGAVIPDLIARSGLTSFNCRLNEMRLNGMLPFRLVGIFPAEQKVIELLWDGKRLENLEYEWERRHWFSSSISDALAAENRRHVCEATALDSPCWDEQWLATLHCSHNPEQGPYSICMHRPDASTVSRTMVQCTSSSVSMRYASGNPCRNGGTDFVATIAKRFAEPGPLTAKGQLS